MPLSLGSTSWIPSGNGTIRNNDITSVDNGVFIGYCDLAANASQPNKAQLFNPAASGVTVLLDSFWGYLGIAPYIGIVRYDVQLTTDVGTGEDINGNGNASLAHIREQQSAGHLGSPISYIYDPLSLGTMTYPIAIAEGCGIAFQSEQANYALQMTFIWREI